MPLLQSGISGSRQDHEPEPGPWSLRSTPPPSISAGVQSQCHCPISSTVTKYGRNPQIEAVEAGQAQGLVVAKLDRLTRSLLDFAGSWSELASAAGISSPSTWGSTPRLRQAR